jgi:hypothetical protein
LLISETTVSEKKFLNCMNFLYSWEEKNPNKTKNKIGAAAWVESMLPIEGNSRETCW